MIALKKYQKLFQNKIPEFISSLREYLEISSLVKTLTISEEVTEHDYSTQLARDLEKKYQIIFTLYSEGIHTLKISPENLKFLEEQYLQLGYLYLWCHGLSRETVLGLGKENKLEEITFKASNFIYGAEEFINFFKRNLISIIVDMFRVLSGPNGLEDPFYLLQVIILVASVNFNMVI